MKHQYYILIGLDLCSFRPLIFLPSLSTFVNEQCPDYDSLMAPHHNSLDGPSLNCHSPHLPPLPQCTKSQLAAIQKVLLDSDTIKWSTNCPDATWIKDCHHHHYNNGAAAKDRPILLEPNHNQRILLSIFVVATHGCHQYLAYALVEYQD
jgi:hypothetical protein